MHPLRPLHIVQLYSHLHSTCNMRKYHQSPGKMHAQVLQNLIVKCGQGVGWHACTRMLERWSNAGAANRPRASSRGFPAGPADKEAHGIGSHGGIRNHGTIMGEEVVNHAQAGLARRTEWLTARGANRAICNCPAQSRECCLPAELDSFSKAAFCI